MTYKQALKSNGAEKWLAAMQEENHKLKEKETWSVDRAPQKQKNEPGKWVFKNNEKQKCNCGNV